MMLVRFGQDSHDCGAKVVATAFADLGFDGQILAPSSRLPAKSPVRSSKTTHTSIGMSTMTAGHKTLSPELLKELKGLDREDIMVMVGVIPAQDYAPCATFSRATDLPEFLQA